MLEGDKRCNGCGRLIFSYTKVRVDMKKWEYQCPYCRKWEKLPPVENKLIDYYKDR